MLAFVVEHGDGCYQFSFSDMLPIIISRNVGDYSAQKCWQLEFPEILVIMFSEMLAVICLEMLAINISNIVSEMATNVSNYNFQNC